MLNRAALILKAREPFVRWINESDPDDERPPVSLEEANEDRTVYLIDDLEAENLEQWLTLNCTQLFESELADWLTDESLWPAVRDLVTFQDWFAVECHTVLIDIGEEPLYDDDLEQ